MQFDKANIHAEKAETHPESPEAVVEEATLTDAEVQETYRAAFLEQLRRLSCPGCGDSEFFG
jgi:hypothetical protein